MDQPGDTRGLPCRPTIACTAELVPPGAFEFEAGYLYRRLGGERQVSFPVLFKLTFAPWIQLQVGSNGYTSMEGPSSSRYFDDVTAGAKVNVLDQGKLRPAVSFSLAAGVPTVAESGYVRTYDALLTAYVTKDIGPFHADLNVGLNVWRLDGSPVPQEWVALAVSAPLPWPFGVMVESYYFTDAAPLAMRDGGFLFALSHSPKPWLTFDVGGDIGYFGAEANGRAFSAFVGMSMVPFLLWTP